jgi:hypothetical protein
MTRLCGRPVLAYDGLIDQGKSSSPTETWILSPPTPIPPKSWLDSVGPVQGLQEGPAKQAQSDARQAIP